MTKAQRTQAISTCSFVKCAGGYYDPFGNALKVPNGVSRASSDDYQNRSGCWRVNVPRTGNIVIFGDYQYGGDYHKSLKAAIEYRASFRSLTKKGFQGPKQITSTRKSTLVEPHISWLWSKPAGRVWQCFVCVALGKQSRTIYVGTETTYTEERFNQRLDEARHLKAKWLADYQAASKF